MPHRLEREIQEYIGSRLQAIGGIMTVAEMDLLPAEVTGAKLGQWIKDLNPEVLNWVTADRFHELGAEDSCWWLRKQVTLPTSRPGWKTAVAFDLGPQKGVGHGALLYVNGRELESFTPRKDQLFHGHEMIFLPDDVKPDQEVELLLKIYTGRDHGPSQRAESKRLQRFLLVRSHIETMALYFRGMAVLRVMETLTKEAGSYLALGRVLKGALKELDFSDQTNERLYRSAGKALAVLNDGLRKLEHQGSDLITLVGVGHAHIDVAWTWPYIVTREKTNQTFATAMGLIDRYPEFVFFQSQPQLYEYVKNDSPELYRRIKEAIKKGKWDAEGGTWVEPDCNIPSGEALVRQFVYGRRFFREELGVDSKILWLVDTFGFPYTLPQIARGCGMEFFVTTKLSWNRYNRIPYSFFQWKGPDGTQLPTYFMTIPWRGPEEIFDTYNAVPDPVVIQAGWKKRFPKEPSRQLLNSIGWGDGGGGTTFEMIEWMRALDGFAGKFKGTWEKTYPFLTRQLKESQDELPVWRDELFLEFHRGTLTTHGELKKLNRRAEVALQEAEALCALAGLEDYPAERFRSLWRNVLLNQFHDVLAGSSAHDVFDEARAMFLETQVQADKLTDAAGKRIFGDGKDAIVVFNCLGQPRDAMVKINLAEGKGLADEHGRDVPVQRFSNNTAVVATGEIPAVGFRRFTFINHQEEAKVDHPVSVSKDVLENKFLRVEFDLQQGMIKSIFDKVRNRPVLAGPGNDLQFFEDKPFLQDLSGWEIDRIYEEKPFEGSTQLVSLDPFGGDLQAGILLERKFRLSRIRQEIYLDFNLPILFFRTWVDWHEHETLLKAAFPVDVNASQACFDVQFGHVYRPTHRNTLWDIARYEVPCQKWMDLSEGDYGVSLLNDGKYGCDVHENVLRLTLLRSSVNPDPAADRGFHEFTYALYPHAGPWWQAQTVRYAKELNCRPRVFAARADVPAQRSFLQLQPENLVLETVKGAEDEKAVVVRLYESANTRGSGQLKLNLPFEVRRAALCTMEEKEVAPLTVQDSTVSFEYSPCQILTIKLQP